MKQLLLGLVVSLLVGQAAAWFPKLPYPSSPCARGAMLHHRPCRRSLQPLAASSGQGGGNKSTSLAGGGGAVRLSPYEVPDGTFANAVMQHGRETGWRMEDKIIGAVLSQLEKLGERMETQLKELKTGQEDQLKELKTGQEAQLKELKTGQEAQYTEVKTGLEEEEASLWKLYFLLAIIFVATEKDFVKALLASIFKPLFSK